MFDVDERARVQGIAWLRWRRADARSGWRGLLSWGRSRLGRGIGGRILTLMFAVVDDVLPVPQGVGAGATRSCASSSARSTVRSSARERHLSRVPVPRLPRSPICRSRRRRSSGRADRRFRNCSSGGLRDPVLPEPPGRGALLVHKSHHRTRPRASGAASTGTRSSGSAPCARLRTGPCVSPAHFWPRCGRDTATALPKSEPHERCIHLLHWSQTNSVAHSHQRRRRTRARGAADARPTDGRQRAGPAAGN